MDKKPKNQKEVAELLNNSRKYGSVSIKGSRKQQEDAFDVMCQQDFERQRNELEQEKN